eukprot:gene12264-27564_t
MTANTASQGQRPARRGAATHSLLALSIALLSASVATAANVQEIMGKPREPRGVCRTFFRCAEPLGILEGVECDEGCAGSGALLTEMLQKCGTSYTSAQDPHVCSNDEMVMGGGGPVACPAVARGINELLSRFQGLPRTYLQLECSDFRLSSDGNVGYYKAAEGKSQCTFVSCPAFSQRVLTNGCQLEGCAGAKKMVQHIRAIMSECHSDGEETGGSITLFGDCATGGAMLGGGASTETCNSIAGVLNTILSAEHFQKDGSEAKLITCRSFGPYTLLAPNSAQGFDCATVSGAMNTMIADYLANDRCPAVTTTPTSTTTTSTSTTSTTTVTATTTTDGCCNIFNVDWRDADGSSCADYAAAEGHCELYGDNYAGLGGYTANQACCACGGGARRPQSLCDKFTTTSTTFTTSTTVTTATDTTTTGTTVTGTFTSTTTTSTTITATTT